MLYLNYTLYFNGSSQEVMIKNNKKLVFKYSRWDEQTKWITPSKNQKKRFTNFIVRDCGSRIIHP